MNESSETRGTESAEGKFGQVAAGWEHEMNGRNLEAYMYLARYVKSMFDLQIGVLVQ